MEIEELTFVSTKKTDSKYLNQYEVEYIGKNGEEQTWTLSSRTDPPKCITGQFDIPDAVVIVAYHKKTDSLVVTREYRVPLADYEYSFPAGLVDPGESIEEATRRELKEETGLTVSFMIQATQPLYSSAGMTDESVSMVYVQCEGEPTTKYNEDTELIEVLLVSREKALALCRDKSLKFDAKAWLLLSSFGGTGRII